MRVKTNMTPAELAAVGLGLQDLAKSQMSREYVPENHAEAEMLRRAEAAFDLMMDHLQTELYELLMKEGGE